jgi:diacylglycerol kinase family enzyme
MSATAASAATISRLMPDYFAPRARRRVAVVLNNNALKVDQRVVRALASVTPAEDLYLSHSLEQGREIARTVVRSGYDTVLFGGGDGTLVRGVEHLADAAREQSARVPAVGVLRLGTGNAFADAIGAGPFTWDGLVADVLRARNASAPREMPMLESMGRVTPFCGFGLDAQVLEDHHDVCDALDKSPLRDMVQNSNVRYAASVALRSIPRFLTQKRARVRVVNLGAPAILIGEGDVARGVPVRAGDTIWEGACSLASCSTIPFFGLGLKMFPFAEMRRDRFQLRVGDAGALEVLSQLPALFRGDFRSKRVSDFLCDHIAIEMSQPAPYEIGGELVGRFERVEVKLGESFRVA